MQLLDLDIEAHRTILEQLPVQQLSALSRTCRHFRSCVFEGKFAEKLWRDRCQQQVGEGFLSLHQAGLPQRLPPTARYWQHLCYEVEQLEHVRWWRRGSEQINISADQADAQALAHNDAPGPPMKARLARSGHWSSVIGHLMVVSGGILRDGSLCVDLVILDLATLAFIKPVVFGEVPMTRFRHTGVVVKPEPSSIIEQLVNQRLHPGQRDASQGSVILLFGGYNTMGQEFGGDQFEAVWVAHDGSAVAWVSIKTRGHAPSARFHHTTTSFDGGKQLILYGGEGHEMIDGAGGQPPNVYTLDVSSLTWHKRSTACTVPDGSPGVRSLHIATVRQNPQTGHEELVVLAGYCNNVLAAMNPHRLDLVTWQWFRESGLVPKPGPGDALALPTPRQRAAAEKIGKTWLLMHGGSPTQFLQGNFLDDIHKLHLPTLTWRQPPRVHGRPARALRNIAGHSIEGLIAFGGCIPTIMGIMPVAKTDPLLMGPPPSLDLLLERDPSAPACTLQPLPPHPQQAPKPTQAPPVLLDVRAPPPDILPHPSGATVADLTRPEHQFDPHAWRPDVHQAVMDLPGLGNMGSTKQYWKHEDGTVSLWQSDQPPSPRAVAIALPEYMTAPPATTGSRFTLADSPAAAAYNGSNALVQDDPSPQSQTRPSQTNNLLFDPLRSVPASPQGLAAHASASSSASASASAPASASGMPSDHASGRPSDYASGRPPVSATGMASVLAASQEQVHSRDVPQQSSLQLAPGVEESRVPLAADPAANLGLLDQIHRVLNRPPQAAPSGVQLPGAAASRQQSMQAGMIDDIRHSSPGSEAVQALHAPQQTGTAAGRQNSMGERAERAQAAERYPAGVDTGLVDSSPRFVPWPTAPLASSLVSERPSVLSNIHGEQDSQLRLASRGLSPAAAASERVMLSEGQYVFPRDATQSEDDDSHQATAAAAAAASSAASAAAATPAEQRHSNIGQAMPAAASLQSHAAQSMADRISAQAAHASTSGSGITGIFAPGMGSSPLQYAASQPDVTPPEVADANANDAQVRPAYPAVFSAAMEFVGNDAAASTAHYFRHEVPEDLEATRQPLLHVRPGPTAAEDTPERAFFAAPHTDSRFIAWRVPTTVHDYELTRAQPAGVRFWRQEGTGEFFTVQENEHHQSVIAPLHVTSSESSDSVGSPTNAFQPEEDLNQMPPNGQ